MKINKKQFDQIKKLMPTERKPAKISNQQLLNALLYMIKMVANGEHYQKKYANWHAIYMKFRRWSKKGTIQWIFKELQSQNIIDIQSETLCLDSTSVKVHPNTTGARSSSGSKVLLKGAKFLGFSCLLHNS